MNAEWSTEKTFRLIGLLKKHPVLWNCKNKSYKNRKMKAIAWNTISATLGEHIDHCKRKVESLLASCRRERSKILKSCAVDEPQFVYVPKWIYWNELGFLRDEPNIVAVNSETGTKDVEWAASSRRPLRKRKSGPSKVESQSQEIPSMGVEGQIRQPEKICDEFDAYGITVAAKLRKMDPSQRLYAESIINTILYKGATYQLSPVFENVFFQPQTPIDTISWQNRDIVTAVDREATPETDNMPTVDLFERELL